MDEEGTGSKRSSTLPVPNPKPHPLPRPQAQVKTLGNNTNRNKVVSTSKPSLPPKPQPTSSSLTNSTSKVAQKPARPHCNRNNNIIQSSSNAGLKNRTLHQISEDDDRITKKVETNGINKERESISTVSMETPKVKNVNGTTKEVNNLRTKPLPPRKPLPDFPGDLDNLERDLEKKPPRPYKPPEIMALANAQKSREEIKKDRRKISAPSLGTTSSPCQSPRNSPLSSPRISRQTLPANFEASVSDSKGLYEVVDAVDSSTALPSSKPTAGRRYSSGKIKLATRSRRLPPPAGPPPSIPAPKVDLSSPDGSRRPAPPPPEVDEPTEIKRTTDRALPAVPEAPRPRSVYEDSRFRTSPEGSSSSVNNVSEVFTGGGQSRYAYDSSPDLQHRTTTSERSPVSMATETSYEYTGLDMSLVSEMVECMKSKPRIVSTGEYEIMPEGSAGLYAAVNPNNGFISSLNNRQEVTESSGETTTSTISTVTDNEKSRDQSSLDNSSESSDEGSAYIAPQDEWHGAGGESDTDFFTDDSQSSHDYLDPPPSPPPVPTPGGSLSQVKTWEESNQDIFGDENGAEDRTLEEPLYQVYTAATLARERNISRKSVSSDNSESTVEEYTKGTMQNMRMLWCQLPEVVTSGILDRISENERKRQEAMFEVITSEASYIKSLGILINHFMDEPELNPNCEECVLEKSQYRILFCNVKAIKEMSERFLEDLRTRQKEQVLISTISDIIYKFVCKHFDVYVKYCSNQVYQERMVKSLREKNPRFVEVCSKLEKQQVVQSLNLQSFLVLPMQRITRFPLLVDAICHRCEGGSEEFRRTDAALSEVNKVVKDCNEGARKMERMEEMCLLQSQIEFKTKPIALVTSTRYLLRRGDLMFVQEGEYRSPLKKGKLKIKPNLKPTYLFLFSDLVLIAKKKSEKNFKVLDYATRSMTQVENTVHKNIQCNHMFSLIFLENSDGKTKDYLLSASNETDKTRWIVAFKPPTAKEGELAVYDSWDCPQVQAIHNYNAQQPDELTMHEGDVINVLRKLTDGWYHGERLCDCAQGWFPANHTEEILNEHVRRRNLLQRYRLLAASQHLMGTLMSS